MKYQDMLKHIYRKRTKIDDTVNAILQKCGGKKMRPDVPAADPEILKQQGCLFGKTKD